MTAQLPALQIVIPLLAAPLCVVLHGARVTWLLAVIVSAACFVVSWLVLGQVMSEGPIVYLLGSWAAPWGIEYRIDELNALVLLIVSGISTVVLPAARESVESEIPEERIYLFYTCWLLCLTGLLGMTITGDAFNVFVFLEISSLSTYVLISLSRDRRGLTAAFRYLILGTIGATFLLIGIGLLYQLTGSLNMYDIGQRLESVSESRTVAVAFVFIVVGIGLKAAIFPLHAWLPRAYAHAPSMATAFLAGTATKVSVYLLLRFVVGIFGVEVFDYFTLGEALLFLGGVGAVVASLVAVFQRDLKLLLAYSSVGQIGYMVIGMGFGNVAGTSAALMHLFNHALMKTALFMALAAVMLRVGSVSLDALAGIGRKMPLTAAAFVVGGLSLIGVPLTCGFVSKWYLLTAAFDAGSWFVVSAVIVGSLLAVAYVWKAVEVAYFRPAADAARCEAPMAILAPLWILVLANVYFGIETSLPVGVAERAAVALGLGG